MFIFINIFVNKVVNTFCLIIFILYYNKNILCVLSYDIYWPIIINFIQLTPLNIKCLKCNFNVIFIYRDLNKELNVPIL